MGRLVRRVFWIIQAVAGLGVAMMLGGLALEDVSPGSPLLGLLAVPIGLLPVLFGSRRLNCLGILLLPIACNMSGFGETITGWLGLT